MDLGGIHGIPVVHLVYQVSASNIICQLTKCFTLCHYNSCNIGSDQRSYFTAE